MQIREKKKKVSLLIGNDILVWLHLSTSILCVYTFDTHVPLVRFSRVYTHTPNTSGRYLSLSHCFNLIHLSFCCPRIYSLVYNPGQS